MKMKNLYEIKIELNLYQILKMKKYLLKINIHNNKNNKNNTLLKFIGAN